MKTLVIHPDDRSTDFLRPVYAMVPDKTVITGGVFVEELADLIGSHDRIMMMGHGSPWGLLSVNCFPGSGMHVIDRYFVEMLKRGDNNVYIWCHADRFVQSHGLKGFYTGMFISETGEAAAMGLGNIDQQTVIRSNKAFSDIAGNYIDESMVKGPEFLWQKIRNDYGIVAGDNPVASYNNERLYFCNWRGVINARRI